MRVERLPDSKVPWITRRDIIAHQLKSGSAKLTYHTQGRRLNEVRGIFRELQAAGYGAGVEIDVVEGPVDQSKAAGLLCYSIEPWTGELIPS